MTGLCARADLPEFAGILEENSGNGCSVSVCLGLVFFANRAYGHAAGRERKECVTTTDSSLQQISDEIY